MNLGDGLMFELENGKPKLVLASYGQSKASSKIGFCQFPYRSRTQQKATVISKQYPKESERPQRERKCTGPAGGSHAEQGMAHGRRKTKDRSNTDRGHIMGVVRVHSESKTKTTDESSKVTEKTVKESLVCLTQDQLQQILNTIQASGQNVQDDSNTHIQNGGPAVGTKEECIVSKAMTSGNAELLLDRDALRQQSSPGKGDLKNPLDSSPSGLFSTFGQREREREALEAKRAQWKRELDEQMVLKQQQKANTEVPPQGEPCCGSCAGTSSSDQLLQVQEDMMRTATENTSSKPPQPNYNLRALPAAIRSAFVLGEATPLEHAFSEEKKEEQRRWLEKLEQQREEARLRKKLEKQIQSQAEDHERWAMHFDSFQRGVHLQPLPVPAPERGEPDVSSSLSHHRSHSGALSTAWEAMSAFGGDSIGRASVDTTQVFQPKSSYLRTMTALLDPAQIEERERKRLKQLEHQRAIDAQVEERRRQKEKEEASRQALEQEEERRVARERDLLQQEYLKDTQWQRQKEELHTRKTEELYLSVQKAQEEAQKDKHLQRIRELARKGHDVSNLLRSLECESSSQVSLAMSETTAERVQTPTTARKDTAVQTEINATGPPETEVINYNNGNMETKAIAAQYQLSPNINGSRCEGRLTGKNIGKENMHLAPEADPYTAYARTDRPRGQQVGRKPEWNTQRPSKAFVPASERYPAALQRHRQESRLRRQMELMTLVEKNAFPQTAQHDTSPPASGHPSHLQRHASLHHQKVEDVQKIPPTTVTQRGHSPPVPALRHRPQNKPSPTQKEEATESKWPPSSDYIPYVRTDEVYHLDPLAPISRPSTHEIPQKTHEDANNSRHHTPLARRDTLLNPELLKSTERQQAILKGLSELRQGLLLKRRELETGFNPLLQGQTKNLSPLFHPL
ncbi:coiled-coil domain-containing protein 66 isoform X2 [Electrophorus electricus]|uniref:coiled-coil domain-containing protein 66 isoform X2 n=1 Tax=Electrophorus electricus TaxID=8005 RepID=UPI0015CFAB4C|nr:coiled-coil domain-containing protein 66 isoform X2 [Electrophorus electricus]